MNSNKNIDVIDDKNLTVEIEDNGVKIRLNEAECRIIYDLLNKEYCKEDIRRAIDDKIENEEVSEEILEDELLIDTLTDCYIDNMAEGTNSRETAIDNAFYECRYDVKTYEDIERE